MYCKLLLKSNFQYCKNTVVNCWLKLAPSLSYKSIITLIKEKQTRHAKNLLRKRKKNILLSPGRLSTAKWFCRIQF